MTMIPVLWLDLSNSTGIMSIPNKNKSCCHISDKSGFRKIPWELGFAYGVLTARIPRRNRCNHLVGEFDAGSGDNGFIDNSVSAAIFLSVVIGVSAAQTFTLNAIRIVKSPQDPRSWPGVRE